MGEMLKAPFPAFGGKSAIADVVWSRLGDVQNYIEPFCFSAAVLLRRPHEPRVETLNDANGYVANFWRAVQRDPEAVAAHADWPVNEADLHARHRWLVTSWNAIHMLEQVKADPDYYDAKIAGWWCWGACCWIGSGWCPLPDQLPHMTGGRGVNNSLPEKLPHMDPSRGIIPVPGAKSSSEWQQKPRLGDEGNGIHAPLREGRVQLADAFARGRGVNGNDSASLCADRRAWLTGWMLGLADRLRAVRVCCGHWRRVCDSPSTTTRLGLTGVFLDPPYRMTVNGKTNRSGDLYANDKLQDIDALCDEVQSWCLKWGGVPGVRIVLAGLEGEYPDLEAAGWTVEAWKARGGYGNQSGKVNENAARERLWLSPHCERNRDTLFSCGAA